MVEVKTQFNTCSLESTNTDPEEWYDKLVEYLQKRLKVMGLEILDDDLIAHFFGKDAIWV